MPAMLWLVNENLLPDNNDFNYKINTILPAEALKANLLGIYIKRSALLGSLNV